MAGNPMEPKFIPGHPDKVDWLYATFPFLKTLPPPGSVQEAPAPQAGSVAAAAPAAVSEGTPVWSVCSDEALPPAEEVTPVSYVAEEGSEGSPCIAWRRPGPDDLQEWPWCKVKQAMDEADERVCGCDLTECGCDSAVYKVTPLPIPLRLGVLDASLLVYYYLSLTHCCVNNAACCGFCPLVVTASSAVRGHRHQDGISRKGSVCRRCTGAVVAPLLPTQLSLTSFAAKECHLLVFLHQFSAIFATCVILSLIYQGLFEAELNALCALKHEYILPIRGWAVDRCFPSGNSHMHDELPSFFGCSAALCCTCHVAH